MSEVTAKFSNPEETSISVKKLAKRLDIGITAAYQLVNSEGFYPAFRIGSHILINVDKLKQWVDEQTLA